MLSTFNKLKIFNIVVTGVLIYVVDMITLGNVTVIMFIYYTM